MSNNVTSGFSGSNAIAGATNNSFTAAQSGTYYVQMTNPASGCASYSDTVTVTVKPIPAAPLISASSSLTFCAGEHTVLSSSAATGNQWYKYGVAIGNANGQAYTATQSGTYAVAATENGCTSAQSAGINVTVNAVPVAPTITANKAFPICSGDSVRLQSSATSGNQWFKDNALIAGATGQQLWVKDAGTYTVKAGSNGCASAASAGTAVTFYPSPALPTITATGNRLAVEGGSAAYQWFLNKEPITGTTSSQYTVQQNGLYKVEVTNSNGCKMASTEFNFVASAVNEIVWTNYTISLYPNPVQDRLTIKVAAANGAARRITAEVLDVNGKVVQTGSLEAGLNSLSLKDLPQGVYAVLIKSEKGQSAIQVVKTH